MPERSHEALRTGAATEWICSIEGVGRVRCMSYRDHRGPGGVFRLMPTRSVSADQLGLPRPVQDLAIEPEGLVLVVGPRSSGKRTLMSAFVDLINRTRRDHVITIEREINIVHERNQSFISQREVRGNDDEMLAAARAALREDPDVLVIEDLRTGPLMNVALEAAASGRLVVGGFSAHTAASAIDRIISLYAPEYHRQVQFALADSLRGVVVQVLLRKTGGGRVPAREVLLNTPAVSSVIAEGKTSQLSMAIEGGRRYGMTPLNDALAESCRAERSTGTTPTGSRPSAPACLAASRQQRRRHVVRGKTCLNAAFDLRPSAFGRVPPDTPRAAGRRPVAGPTAPPASMFSSREARQDVLVGQAVDRRLGAQQPLGRHHVLPRTRLARRGNLRRNRARHQRNLDGI